MKRFNRTTLFLTLMCVFLLAVNVSLGLLLTAQSRNAIRTQIENRMLDVSNTAAAMLDGDAMATLQAEDVDTPEYQAVLRTLSYFGENIELSYIYCVRDMGDRSFTFMIDPDPESPGAFGSYVPYTDALYQASLGTASVDQVPYEDVWGRFYSAYTPVFDSQNRVAGIVAVDFSADWYENQISHLVRTTLTFSGVSIAFAALIIFFIASRYRERFRTLFREMNKVSQGIETLVHEVSPNSTVRTWEKSAAEPSEDEIAELGSRIHFLQQNLSEEINFVRSQAFYDGLTGLGNRLAYEDHVKQLDDEIREGRAGFTVAVFDLNGLKAINDKEGHEKGDETIVAAAAAIKQSFPEGKQYRIGGDEFIVILESFPEDLPSRMEGLREENSGVSISMGWAKYEPKEDLGFHTVFHRADMAMYNDKREYYLTHGDRRRR